MCVSQQPNHVVRLIPNANCVCREQLFVCSVGECHKIIGKAERETAYTVYVNHTVNRETQNVCNARLSFLLCTQTEVVWLWRFVYIIKCISLSCRGGYLCEIRYKQISKQRAAGCFALWWQSISLPHSGIGERAAAFSRKCAGKKPTSRTHTYSVTFNLSLSFSRQVRHEIDCFIITQP